MFKINLKAQREAGVGGIILDGSLGEASAFSNEGKKQLYVEARAFLPENFPLIINIVEQTTTDAVALGLNETEKHQGL